MATVTALRSSVGDFDAYGITQSPPYGGGDDLNIPGSPPYDAVPLLVALKKGHAADEVTFTQVTFDDATDLLGTSIAYGKVGVIGLWLSSYTESAPIAYSSIYPSDYLVPDLRPANNGYMPVRGFVWPPDGGALAKRPYP
ncbi:MAG TPA: hypothetical protein VJU80_08640 [Solirubrobacteraceae bacterium]|nr:hypothetical protein [Solirubrobacteraceae bacterium]